MNSPDAILYLEESERIRVNRNLGKMMASAIYAHAHDIEMGKLTLAQARHQRDKQISAGGGLVASLIHHTAQTMRRRFS